MTADPPTLADLADLAWTALRSEPVGHSQDGSICGRCRHEYPCPMRRLDTAVRAHRRAHGQGPRRIMIDESTRLLCSGCWQPPSVCRRQCQACDCADLADRYGQTDWLPLPQAEGGTR